MSGPSASPHIAKTAAYLTVAVLANSFGNLLLALGMDNLPHFGAVPIASYLAHVFLNPYLLPGVALTAIYNLSEVSMFSWADLSFVVPCIASSYIVTTLLGQFILGEAVGLMRWGGIALIFLGVALVAETPVATKEHPHVQDQIS